MNDPAVMVHVDIAGEPRLVGRLWARVARGRETASFEYALSWLRDADRARREARRDGAASH